MPTTEACSRCEEPNASSTKSPSQRAASWRENASSFFSSSAWKRTFSSKSTSPSRRALLCASASGPTQSPENATGFSSNSWSFFATGFSEYLGSGPPFGRPRCEARTSRPPFCIARRNVGRVSRMRVSSVTTPSFKGTLKSARMKTRLPRRSKSSIVSLFIEFPCFPEMRPPAERFHGNQPPEEREQKLEFARHELDQVAATAGVPPLVVVPGEHLDAAIAHDLRIAGVHNRRIGVAAEIGGNQFLLGVGKDSLHRPFGGCLERGVDGLHRRRLVHKDGQVHDADVRRGDTHGIAVQLALQFRND